MTIITAYFECTHKDCTFGLRAIKDGDITNCPVCYDEGRGAVRMLPEPGTEIPHEEEPCTR